jgi:hypothetical protein
MPHEGPEQTDMTEPVKATNAFAQKEYVATNAPSADTSRILQELLGAVIFDAEHTDRGN